MELYYVYILQCSDNSFYVGMTSNLEKRIMEHSSGFYKQAYTYNKRPLELKWVEQFPDPSQALLIEKQIKGWTRKKKIALIEKDWERLIKLSRNYTQFGKYE